MHRTSNIFTALFENAEMGETEYTTSSGPLHLYKDVYFSIASRVEIVFHELMQVILIKSRISTGQKMKEHW